MYRIEYFQFRPFLFVLNKWCCLVLHPHLRYHTAAHTSIHKESSPRHILIILIVLPPESYFTALGDFITCPGLKQIDLFHISHIQSDFPYHTLQCSTHKVATKTLFFTIQAPNKKLFFNESNFSIVIMPTHAHKHSKKELKEKYIETNVRQFCVYHSYVHW